MSDTTNIATSTSIARATINCISSGGSLGANISSVYVNKVHAGVDQSDRRLPETDDFTGADVTGSIGAILRLKEVSATGAIRNATLQSNFGHITNVFAEDGFIDSTAQAGKTVKRIMVGYMAGKRNHIVNESADVSGSVNARKLGRIYYTGSRTIDLSGARRVGPLVDDVEN